MKKFISILVVAVLFGAGLFAVDLGSFPKGTWQDSKWNADWVFAVDGIQLRDSNTNDLIFDFARKIENFKVTPSTAGVSVSFTCAETERSYKFTKPTSLDTNITMEIQPEWTSENYKVSLPMKK